MDIEGKLTEALKEYIGKVTQTSFSYGDYIQEDVVTDSSLEHRPVLLGLACVQGQWQWELRVCGYRSYHASPANAEEYLRDYLKGHHKDYKLL